MASNGYLLCMSLRILLLWLLLALPTWAVESASPTFNTYSIPVATHHEAPLRINLGASIWWVADPKHSIQSDQLISNDMALPDGMSWTLNQSQTPNLGFSDAPFWFFTRLTNDSQTRRTGLLEIAYPILDYVDVFIVNGQGNRKDYATGDLRPVSSRAIEHRNFLFPLSLDAGETVTVLIRTQTERAMQLPIKYWEEKAFFEKDQLIQAVQFIFAGIMLAIALYNLLIWVFVRLASYLWYILNVVTIALVQLSLHGMTALYLWPEHPWLNNHALVSFITLNIVFVCLFTYSFLSLQERGRFIRWFVKGFGGIGALVFVLSWFIGYGLSVRLAVLAITVGAPVVLFIGLYLSFRGDVLAKFYTIAWSILLLGHFLLAFNKIGIFPRTLFFEYAPQFGAALEVILLSFALAYRINLERQERFTAQQRALEAERQSREANERMITLQREANEQLETKVRERTRELEAANRQLRDMSSMDGLTGIHNRRYFDETLFNEWSKGTREPSHICLLLIDVDHFKRFNDQYGHLCGDACLRHLAELLKDSVKRAGDFVARFGGEEFAVLLCHTELEGGAIVAERIRRKVAASPFFWEGQSLFITISIGVAGLEPIAQEIPKSLISSADEALYAAKAAGRNQVMTAAAMGQSNITPLGPDTLAKI